MPLSIAQYVMTVEYKPYPSSFYHLDKLKSLTRFRNSLVRQRSRQTGGAYQRLG